MGGDIYKILEKLLDACSTMQEALDMLAPAGNIPLLVGKAERELKEAQEMLRSAYVAWREED